MPAELMPISSSAQPQPRRLLWLLNNGPAIIAVLGSGALSLIASFVAFTEIQLLQAVLALLALIGTSLVTERLVEGRELRRQVQEIDEQLSAALEYARKVETRGLDDLIVRRRDLPPLENRIEGAQRLSISGGSLYRLVNEYRPLFERLAAGGCSLRFLVTDPDAPAAEVLSATVAYEAIDTDTYRAHMRGALAGLRHLAELYPDRCELRTCTIAPSFSLFVIEKQDALEVQVELYPFRVPARDRPLFAVKRERDSRLTGLFSAQFEAMWTSPFAERVEPRSPPQDRKLA